MTDLNTSYSTGYSTGPVPPQSTDRIVLSGSGTAQWDIKYNGVSMRTNGGTFHGYNFGAYGAHGGLYAPTTIALATAQAVTDGVSQIRNVGYGRWFGIYTKSPGANSRDDNCFTAMSAVNWQDQRDSVRASTSAGIWTTVGHDSDCGACGTQDATTDTFCEASIQPGEVPCTMDSTGAWTPIPGGLTFLQCGGYNYFTSPYLFARLATRWLMYATEFRSYPKIFAYEPLSEPLSQDPSTVGPGYDNTSTFNGLTWPQRVANLYRVIRSIIRQVDTVTPLLVGSWDSYGLDQLADLVPLLSDLTDLLYTWDALDSGSAPPNHVKQPSHYMEAMALNVPLYMNQLGTRSTNDTSSYGLNAGFTTGKAFGVPVLWWESREAILSNNSTDYGLQYSPDGGTTWTTKTQQMNFFRAQLGYTVTGMLAAQATAVAGATSGVAFYVNASLPGAPTNAWKDSGKVAACTAVGDTLGFLSPAAGAGLNFSNTANLPLLQQSGVIDGSGNSWLPDKFPAFVSDGTKFLKGDSTFYTLGSEDQTIIIAICPGIVSSNKFLLACGNSAGTTSYPILRINASGFAQAIWTDGTNTATCTGTTSLNPTATTWTPAVITAKKVGNVCSLYVNGVLEATQTVAVGAVAPSRLNILADSHLTANYAGSLTYAFFCKNGLSDANRIAIERASAYMVAAPYQL